MLRAFRCYSPVALLLRCYSRREHAVGILVATAGLAYLIMLAEEKQRHKETDAKAAKARDAAAAHGQHPLLPRK